MARLFVLANFLCLRIAVAAVTFTNLDGIAAPESLADGFKVSLIRPPDEPANSGQKMIVEQSSIHLLSDEERQTLDDYDSIFEKYSLFCNGRWLGAQVLQDSQDLMYMQHIVYMKKPDVIIETGTYKGGLTYFFASLLDWIDRESEVVRDTKVLSVDRHHPDMVFAANWFCPVCIDCIKPYAQPVWERKVRFIQGMADSENTLQEIAANLVDLQCLQPPEDGSSDGSAAAPGASPLSLMPSKTVLVNLDANHEFEGLMRELLQYAPLVSENSYLIVQDAKLDKIWGVPGPTAALNTFINLAPPGEFVIEDELKFHAYSQHIYLRRVRVSVPHAYFMQKALAAMAQSS